MVRWCVTGRPRRSLRCVSQSIGNRAFQFAIRFVMRIDSFCKKNRPFDSAPLKLRPYGAIQVCLLLLLLLLVVMQFFLADVIVCGVQYSRTSAKNSYAMHTIKVTPNVPFECQCTSGKFIRLPNLIGNKIDSVARIESKLFWARIGKL